MVKSRAQIRVPEMAKALTCSPAGTTGDLSTMLPPDNVAHVLDSAAAETASQLSNRHISVHIKPTSSIPPQAGDVHSYSCVAMDNRSMKSNAALEGLERAGKGKLCQHAWTRSGEF